MVQFFDDGIAIYRNQTECTCGYRTDTGTVRSSSFGSCVGLVLYRKSSKAGAVAHFSGSMGHKDHLETARADVRTIMLNVAHGSTDSETWLCWIFGGTSLRKDTDFSGSSVQKQTKTLIDTVRHEVSKQANIFAVAMQIEGYEGHSGVTLDVASGELTWEDSTPSKGAQEVGGKKERRLSF